MPELREDFLQFAWKHGLFGRAELRTTSGKKITVVKQGELNRDAGPDFFNAQIKTDNLTLAGNIEVHLKTSDWLRHGHQDNSAYDNLVLHVVYEHDAELPQNTKHNVEVVELKNYLSEETITRYGKLISAREKLPCAKQIHLVNNIHFMAWLERMAVERLEHKTEQLEKYFETTGRNFTEVFYKTMLRNFGFKVNALPFELLSDSLPLALLLKHADSLLQLEALLLGTAGLLEQQFEHEYILRLQNEYEFLKNKYRLIPLKKELFKFARLRPANFPTLRLAQFAALVFHHPNLFSRPHETSAYDGIKKLLRVQTSEYWSAHYTLSGPAGKTKTGVGENTIQNLIINSFAPFLFFCSRKMSKPRLLDASLDLLQRCAFEENFKTKLFLQKKNVLVNASCSQALINLYDNYCTQKKCLHCAVALNVLKN